MNLEHQLDSDYEAPPEDVLESVTARSPPQRKFSSSRLVHKANDLIDLGQEMHSTSTKRFGRKTDDLENVLSISEDELSSAKSLRIPESPKDVQAHKKSVLEELADPDSSVASTIMIRTHDLGIQPDDELA